MAIINFKHLLKINTVETLTNLESFVRSAEAGGFSAAARTLALTPAAVSRNVGMLEANLGIRLFHRSTRQLTLTEQGERFLYAIRGNLHALQSAISDINSERDEPSGVLKVSMVPSFAMEYVLPLVPALMARYPRIRLDWQLENRQVNLAGEGVDVAIGGGIQLAPGVVARHVGPAHVVAVAAPSYLQGRAIPQQPRDLATLAGIVMRSVQTGRVQHWTLRNAQGDEALAAEQEQLVLNDPDAISQAAVLGLGVALAPMPHVLAHLEQGRLVRLLPQWYADAGSISMYYSSRVLLPAKTRVFIDYVVAAFAEQDLARRFSGTPATAPLTLLSQ